MKDSIWLKLSPGRLQFVFDLLFLSLGFFIFFYFRFESGLLQKNIEFGIEEVITVNIVLIIYWLIVFWGMGLYKNLYNISPFEELWKVITTLFFGSFVIFFLVFMDSTQSPRVLFLIYFAVLSLSVCLGRTLARRLQRNLRKNRIIAYPTLIIAKVSEANEIINRLNQSPSWGMKPIGFVHIDKQEFLDYEEIKLSEQIGIPVMGHIEFLPEILDEYNPKDIIIADDSPGHDILMKITGYCSDNKIKVKIPPTLYDIFTGQTKAFPLYGIPFIEISSQLLKPWEEVIKRIFDVVFSAMVIILGLPFWLLLSFFVKIDSSGKIFYTQTRVGKNGKIFTIFKFRSMVSDADRLGGAWTSVNDNRVTKFGRFIRKTHLDEIPQFLNVLIGDMSIVGPRPERDMVVKKYISEIPYYNRRHLVRPGITGWWQVNYGPYIESVEEIKNRLKDDFYYIENMSLKLDLEIIIRTVYCVIKGHGQA